MADDYISSVVVLLVVLVVLFLFTRFYAFCENKNQRRYNRIGYVLDPQPRNNDHVRSIAEEFCISGNRSETLPARSSRPATVEFHSKPASNIDVASRSTADTHLGRVSTVTTLSSTSSTVEVRSRPALYSEAASRPPAAVYQKDGVAKVEVQSRSVLYGKKASRVAITASYHTEERLYGEFLCNKCNRLWMSSYSWVNTAQKCRRCDIWVLPFKQTKLFESENKSDPSKRHPQELCSKCTRLGRFCAEGSYYTN